jgi:hypothetical protein
MNYKEVTLREWDKLRESEKELLLINNKIVFVKKLNKK